MQAHERECKGLIPAYTVPRGQNQPLTPLLPFNLPYKLTTMEQPRRLACAPVHASVIERTSSNPKTKTNVRQQRSRHSKEQWEQKKAVISQLYKQQQKKVVEILAILREQHGFPVGYMAQAHDC